MEKYTGQWSFVVAEGFREIYRPVVGAGNYRDVRILAWLQCPRNPGSVFLLRDLTKTFNFQPEPPRGDLERYRETITQPRIYFFRDFTRRGFDLLDLPRSFDTRL